MPIPDRSKYRWVAPDGRRGRWRASPVGAVVSAVGQSASDHAVGVKVVVDALIAQSRWPELQAAGWSLERGILA